MRFLFIDRILQLDPVLDNSMETRLDDEFNCADNDISANNNAIPAVSSVSPVVSSVIPAKAGNHVPSRSVVDAGVVDPRLRGDDSNVRGDDSNVRGDDSKEHGDDNNVRRDDYSNETRVGITAPCEEKRHAILGLKHITRDDYFLCKAQDGRQCFIPSLIGEALGQLAAWKVMASNDFSKRPVAGVVSCAHVYRPAYVGETLLLEAYIDDLDDVAVRYHGVARVGDEVVFRLDSALGPLLPMSDFIEQTDVRQQFAEINRPGPWPIVRNTDVGLDNTSTGPCAAPMLFDTIVSSEPGIRLCAEKRISRAAAYFPDHFPQKPVLPMTVLLECKLNLAQEFLARAQFPEQYEVCELRKIKMNEFVFPGDVLMCTLTVKHHQSGELILNYRSEVDGRRVCVLDVVMRAKGLHE